MVKLFVVTHHLGTTQYVQFKNFINNGYQKREASKEPLLSQMSLFLVLHLFSLLINLEIDLVKQTWIRYLCVK